MKKTQLVMMWFLPLITVMGLFFPILGYLVVAMIVFFLILSIFKERYWCWNLCPRGSFLDGVMTKVSPKNPLPRFVTQIWFRLLMFALILPVSFLVWRIIPKDNIIESVGAAFVSICLVTTIVAIFLAAVTKPRSWCVICPMGKIQVRIGKISRAEKKKDAE